MGNTSELHPDIQAVLTELDKATEAVASALKRCADYVNSGELDGNVMMLKLHSLQAKLMGIGE